MRINIIRFNVKLLTLAAIIYLTACENPETLLSFKNEIRKIDANLEIGNKFDSSNDFFKNEGVVFYRVEKSEIDKNKLLSSDPLLSGRAVARIEFIIKENDNNQIVKAGLKYYVDLDKDGNILQVTKTVANTGP